MYQIRILTLAGLSLVIGALSTSAFAVSSRTAATARAEVAQLVRAMDRDMNGAVSRAEFLEYMGAVFDRLDTNRSNQLERGESSRLRFGRRTANEAGSDAARLIRLMDRDQNSAVSKEEFLQFMGQTFDRLDVNRSGELEPHELYPAVVCGGRSTACIPNWDRRNDPADHPF
jgi:Ca2+-binding EF-hand superfamily protein